MPARHHADDLGDVPSLAEGFAKADRIALGVDGDDRLQIEQLAERSRHGLDPSALYEVLERVHADQELGLPDVALDLADDLVVALAPATASAARSTIRPSEPEICRESITEICLAPSSDLAACAPVLTVPLIPPPTWMAMIES